MTDQEIVQALRSCANGESEDCPFAGHGVCGCPGMSAELIERLSTENESLRKEFEWKDMVISLAQRKQAEAEAERDALLRQWTSVGEELPAPGTRVIATDGYFVGEAYRTISGAWNRYDGVAMRDCLGSIVTHWMPLPEAPMKGDVL